MVEERKLVTVVFCDLVGSTELSERLDPETLRTVTLRYFAAMRSAIERFGGTVEKFIGDAVMAVFGVPVMREDDAVRGAAAALAMREELAALNAELAAGPGVRLRIRIGVATGLVVAGTDVSTRQTLVSGETVNVAARLEQNAGADEILIGELTRRSVGDVAVVADAGALPLKGKSELVPAFRLLGLAEGADEAVPVGSSARVSGSGAAGSAGAELTFVGRAAQLRALDRALRGADQGVGFVALCAEPGMGKTRLVRTWLERAVQAGAVSRYGAGRCRSYGDHASLAPLAEAVRQLVGSSDVPDAESAAVLTAGLLADGTPGASLEGTCAALGQALAGWSAAGPVVLAVDDVQWASPALLDALDLLLSSRMGGRVLITVLGRTELLDRRPSWTPHALALPPLSRRRSRDLLTAAGPTLPPARAAAILDSAGGNPLHLEQLLIAWREAAAGVTESTDMTPTLRALLGARIDAVTPPERATLDLAAILGREVEGRDIAALAAGGPEGAAGGPLGGERLSGIPATDAASFTDTEDAADLDAVVAHTATDLAETPSGNRGTETALVDLPAEGTATALIPTAIPTPIAAAFDRLCHRRLLEPAGATTSGFRFSSGLIHDAVYHAMAKRARAERHARAADLAASGAMPVATEAVHLERAWRYRVELGERDENVEALRSRAVERLAEAGAHAWARSDPQWADTLLSRAAELLTEGDPAWPGVARRLGEARIAAGQVAEGRALLRRVLTVASREADPAELAHARLTLAVTDPDAAVGAAAAAARAAMPVFATAGDVLGQARARIRLAQEQQFLGRHAAAIELLAAGLDDALCSAVEPELAQALGAYGVSLWRGPTPVEEAVARCRDLLTEHGGPRPVVRMTLRCPLAVLLALDDRHDAARTELAAARRAGAGLGYAESEVVIPMFEAVVSALAGHSDAAIPLFAQAERAAARIGAGALRAAIVRQSVRVHLDEGRVAEARAGLDAIDDNAEELRADAADAFGLRARLACVAEPRDPDRALTLAACGVAAAAKTDSPVVRAAAALDQALVYGATGQPDRARRAAHHAAQVFAAKGHRPGLRQAEAIAQAFAAPAGEEAR